MPAMGCFSVMAKSSWGSRLNPERDRLFGFRLDGDQLGDQINRRIPPTFLRGRPIMPRFFNPAAIAAPAGNRYHHGAEVTAGARMLYLAGQTGTAPS